MSVKRTDSSAHLSCDRASASTGKSPCSPTTPSIRLGRMEITRIKPSCDPVNTVSSSNATNASTELGCPAHATDLPLSCNPPDIEHLGQERQLDITALAASQRWFSLGAPCASAEHKCLVHRAEAISDRQGLDSASNQKGASYSL